LNLAAIAQSSAAIASRPRRVALAVVLVVAADVDAAVMTAAADAADATKSSQSYNNVNK